MLIVKQFTIWGILATEISKTERGNDKCVYGAGESNRLGISAHAFKEAGAGASLCVQGQHGLYSEFQDS